MPGGMVRACSLSHILFPWASARYKISTICILLFKNKTHSYYLINITKVNKRCTLSIKFLV
ncbi:hypothetical protein E4T73_01930 [Staphylococcus arlettae]|nr:hypothetical protein E4T73_01930 [Staphylococcus arlettae]